MKKALILTREKKIFLLVILIDKIIYELLPGYFLKKKKADGWLPFENDEEDHEENGHHGHAQHNAGYHGNLGLSDVNKPRTTGRRSRGSGGWYSCNVMN